MAGSAAHTLDLIEPRTGEALAMLQEGEGPDEVAGRAIGNTVVGVLSTALQSDATQAGRDLSWHQTFDAAAARVADVVRATLPLSTIVRALTAPSP